MEQKPTQNNSRNRRSQPAARQAERRAADSRPPARGQTPQSRQQPKAQPQKPKPKAQPSRPKPKPLTPEQKRRRAELLRRRQARAKRARKRFAASLLVFLTFYILLSAIVFAIFFFSFHNVAGNDALYAVSIKLTEKKSVLYDEGDVNLDYGLYVPVSALERLHDITVTGDGGARTVAVRETGDTLACTDGSSLVYINGTPVRLDSPVVLTEDDCYLPAEAVTGYMRLFACTYDDENRLLVIALADETAGYALKTQPPETPAEYPENESSGATSGE